MIESSPIVPYLLPRSEEIGPEHCPCRQGQVCGSYESCDSCITRSQFRLALRLHLLDRPRNTDELASFECCCTTYHILHLCQRDYGESGLLGARTPTLFLVLVRPSTSLLGRLYATFARVVSVLAPKSPLTRHPCRSRTSTVWVSA